MGGKSSKQTVGYKYFVGVHMVLCHGTADRVTRARVAKRNIFEDSDKNVLGSRFISINLPDLFGGEAREGGIVGTMAFQDGKGTQTTLPYLQSKIGGDVPAFRGVAAITLQQMNIGNNPYLKNWDFRVQRIHIAADDAVQWNDTKSSIEFGSTATIRLVEHTENFEIVDLSGNTIIASLQGPFGDTVPTSPPANPVVDGITDPVEGDWDPVNSLWETDTQINIRKTFTVTEANVTVRIFGRIENGVQCLVDGVIVGELNFTRPSDNLADTPPFEFIVDNLTVGPHTLELRCNDEEPVSSNSITYVAFRVDQQAGSYEAMNPAHIIRECLTNKDWGMGYDPSDIDSVAFAAVADVLHDVERMGLCMIWSKQESIEDFIDRVKKHANAEVYVDRISGLFVMKLIRDDYVVASLPVLDQTNIARITNFRRPAFGELTNSVTVTYYDMGIGDDSSITVHDIALIEEQGNEILTTNQYPGFPNADLASRAAQRDLHVLSSPLISCVIFTNLVTQNFNIGDEFVLNWPDFEISGVVMRITSANYGNSRTNVVRLTCVQDVFTMPTVGIVPSNRADWEMQQVIPLPVVNQAAFEIPYFEAVQTSSQTAINQAIADNINVGYVGIAAQRPEGAISASFHTDAGSGFSSAGALDFCPAAKLAVSIDRLVKTFEVSDIDDVVEVSAGTWFQLDDELMSFESLVGTTLTVKRGVLDTVPEIHISGAVLLFWDEISGADPTEYVASDIVDVKITPISGFGTLNIESALQSTVNLNSRAARPYPPGDVKIDTVSFPTSGSGNMALTWKSRNRLLQTSGILTDWFDDSITPESGITYTVRAIDDLGAVEHETTGITNLFFTLPELLKSVAYTIEVTTVRDALESFQAVRSLLSYVSTVVTILIRSVAQQQDNGSLLTLALAFPASIASGDLLVAAVSHRGSGVALTTPAGWALAFTTTESVTTFQKISIYTKVATGSESGTEAFTSTDNGRKNGYMFSVGGATGLGANLTTETAGSTNTITPTWTGPTIYIYDWDFALNPSVSSVTGLDEEFGVTAAAQLRMYAGFGQGDESVIVTIGTSGSTIRTVAIELTQ